MTTAEEALRHVFDKCGMDAARGLLHLFGANRLSELHPVAYGAFVRCARLRLSMSIVGKPITYIRLQRPAEPPQGTPALTRIELDL
jgi:hypothetical protein